MDRPVGAEIFKGESIPEKSLLLLIYPALPLLVDVDNGIMVNGPVKVAEITHAEGSFSAA